MQTTVAAMTPEAREAMVHSILKRLKIVAPAIEEERKRLRAPPENPTRPTERHPDADEGSLAAAKRQINASIQASIAEISLRQREVVIQGSAPASRSSRVFQQRKRLQAQQATKVIRDARRGILKSGRNLPFRPYSRDTLPTPPFTV